MRRLATLLTLVLLGLSCSGSGKNARDKATPTIRPVESNTQRNITGVWIDSEGTLWLATPPPVGERNPVQSFADGTWTDRSRGFPPGWGVAEFWGNSSGVLIGYNWDQVWRYVDGDWKLILDVRDIDPIGVSGSEDGTIVVVCAYYINLYHFHVDRADEAERGGWDLALGDVWVFDKDHYVTVPTIRVIIVSCLRPLVVDLRAWTTSACSSSKAWWRWSNAWKPPAHPGRRAAVCLAGSGQRGIEA